jgi:hypothetical protein
MDADPNHAFLWRSWIPKSRAGVADAFGVSSAGCFRHLAHHGFQFRLMPTAEVTFLIQANTVRWLALMAAFVVCAMLAILGGAFHATPAHAILSAGQAAATPTPKPFYNGHPSVSPDGSHIAFTSNRRGAAEGSGQRQVTDAKQRQ